VIYVDGNLPRSVADELRKIGKEAVAKIEIFDPDTKDPVWLRKVGESGWLGITRDARIRSRPGEVRAIVEHKVGCFILTYKNDIKKPEIIRIVLDNIEEMEEKFRTTPRPFLYTVTKDGEFRHYVPKFTRY
jgi:predicted nuclease of predicted toxin-antitoxin system